MMNSFRKQMKSTAFKLIIWLGLFSIIGGVSLLVFVQNVFLKQNFEGIASVNNLAIPVSDYRRQARYLYYVINQIKQIYGAQADMLLSLWGIDAKSNPEKMALENLIQQKVVQSAAENSGFNIGADYITQKLQDNEFVKDNLSNIIPNDVFENGKLNTSSLIQALKAQQTSLEDFEALLKEIIERNLFVDSLQSLSYIPQDLLKEQYIKHYSKKKFNILELDINNYIKKSESEKLNQAEIESYFDLNKENYRVPEFRSVNLWSFNPDSYQISISEQDIKDFAEKNDRDLEKDKSDIERQLRLEKFETDFKNDAKRVLNQSRDNVAILDNFVKNKKAIKSEINSVKKDASVGSEKVFSLAKINDKAFYLNEGQGYIVELKSISKSYIPDLSAVKDSVIKDIYRSNALDLIKKDLNEILKSNKTIEELAKIFNAKLEKTDLLELNSSNKAIKDKNIPNSLLVELIQSKDKVEHLSENIGYIVELEEIEPFNEKDFDSKKDALESQLSQSQVKNIFQDLLTDWQKKADIRLNKELLRL